MHIVKMLVFFLESGILFIEDKHKLKISSIHFFAATLRASSMRNEAASFLLLVRPRYFEYICPGSEHPDVRAVPR